MCRLTSISSLLQSMISSGSMPATGQPTTLRVSSPQAPLVVMPTDSSAAKISGMSSMRSQCIWMVWRVVMSEKPWANRSVSSRDDAGLGGSELAAGDLCAEHEVAGVLGLLAIDAVPLEALEIVIGDGGETALRVAVDIVDDGEAVFLLLELLLGGEGDEALLDGGEIGMDFDH